MGCGSGSAAGVVGLGCCGPQVTSVNRYIAALYVRLFCARSGPCLPYKTAKKQQRTIGVDPAFYGLYNWDTTMRFDPRGPSYTTITTALDGTPAGEFSFVSDLLVNGSPVVITSDTATSIALTATHYFEAGGTIDFSWSYTLLEPYTEAEIQADLLALYNDFNAADFAAPFIGGLQDFRRSWANDLIVPFGAFPQDSGESPPGVMNAWGIRKLDRIERHYTAGIPGMSFPAVAVSRSVAKAIIQLAGVPPTQRPYCKLTFGGVSADCDGVMNTTGSCEQGTLANPITIEGTALAAGTGVLLQSGVNGCVCNPAP